jgi:hypothetical protein
MAIFKQIKNSSKRLSSKDKFKLSTIDTCKPIKRHVHNILTSTMTPSSKFLGLDGQTCYTTKRLHKVGLPKYNIHVPNMCKETCRIIKKFGKSTSHNTTLNNYIKKMPANTFTHLFYDYTCTWKNAKADVVDTFRKNIVKSNFKFALTLSAKVRKGSVLENGLIETDDFIGIAKDYGYIATLVESFYYVLYKGHKVKVITDKPNNNAMKFQLYECVKV